MKKLRLYFDTSVFNFVFADDVPKERSATLTIIEQVRQDRYEVFISDLVTTEILDAPIEKSKQLIGLIEELNPKTIDTTDECLVLAHISPKVYPGRDYPGKARL